MTDLVRLIKFLEMADIGYEYGASGGAKGGPALESTITLTAQEHKNVGGYTGFQAVFTFDAENKSIGMSVWE